MIETTSLGVEALDKALMDGVPRGHSILVTGAPGSGIELFAKQFAQAGIGKENVIYFSTSERGEDVINTMKEFGWKTDMRIVNIGKMHYERVLAKHLEVSKYRQEGLKMSDILTFKQEPHGVSASTNFLTSFTYEISKVKPPFRIVLDSLDFFLEYYDPGEVLSALRTVKAHTLHNGGVAMVTMLKSVFDTRTESGVEDIVDVIIEMERQREGSNFKRNLLVRKVKNHPEKTQILSCAIDGNGISAKVL